MINLKKKVNQFIAGIDALYFLLCLVALIFLAGCFVGTVVRS